MIHSGGFILSHSFFFVFLCLICNGATDDGLISLTLCGGCRKFQWLFCFGEKSAKKTGQGRISSMSDIGWQEGGDNGIRVSHEQQCTGNKSTMIIIRLFLKRIFCYIIII